MNPIFAYCRVSISPVRGEMKDSAEQVTQLLFGELICVQDKNNNWLKITTLLDRYEGWIDEKQIAYLQSPVVGRRHPAWRNRLHAWHQSENRRPPASTSRLSP